MNQLSPPSLYRLNVGDGFAPADNFAVANGRGVFSFAIAHDAPAISAGLCGAALCFSTPREQVDIGVKGIARKAERKGYLGGCAF